MDDLFQSLMTANRGSSNASRVTSADALPSDVPFIAIFGEGEFASSVENAATAAISLPIGIQDSAGSRMAVTVSQAPSEEVPKQTIRLADEQTHTPQIVQAQTSAEPAVSADHPTPARNSSGTGNVLHPEAFPVAAGELETLPKQVFSVATARPASGSAPLGVLAPPMPRTSVAETLSEARLVAELPVAPNALKTTANAPSTTRPGMGNLASAGPVPIAADTAPTVIRPDGAKPPHREKERPQPSIRVPLGPDSTRPMVEGNGAPVTTRQPAEQLIRTQDQRTAQVVPPADQAQIPQQFTKSDVPRPVPPSRDLTATARLLSPVQNPTPVRPTPAALPLTVLQTVEPEIPVAALPILAGPPDVQKPFPTSSSIAPRGAEGITTSPPQARMPVPPMTWTVVSSSAQTAMPQSALEQELALALDAQMMGANAPATSSFSASAVPLSPNGTNHTPMLVAQQIAAALSDRNAEPGQPLELALDPPELGRVRMQLVELAGVLTLTIHAERPETAELMRRHLDLLNQEFSEAGIDAPSVSISQDRSNGRSGGDDPERPGEQASETPAAHSPETPQSQSVTPTGAMDLRL